MKETDILKKINTQLDQTSQLLYNKFYSDQDSYALQQTNGSYKRLSGIVTKDLIKKNLINEGSIALYQKNTDQTVNWICYDFDILKKHLNNTSYNTAKKELEKQIKLFCEFLKKTDIPFLLEFSGNRGYHVWIIFGEKIDYSIASEILDKILLKSKIKVNFDLIAIDKFPSRKQKSSGIGKAVKIPLSKHKKSLKYSYLLNTINETKDINKITKELLIDQSQILTLNNSTTKGELEKKLDEFFSSTNIDKEESFRIKAINIEDNNEFTSDYLLDYWKSVKPLKKLSELILEGNSLKHEHRLLIVGLLKNIKLKNGPYFSNKLIHELFSKQKNYNKNITNKAITKLQSYNFPTQKLIENILKDQFDQEINVIEDLVKICIPLVTKIEEAVLDFSIHDIEVTSAAEVNYLYTNDEVQINSIFNTLDNVNRTKMLNNVHLMFDNLSKCKFYKHTRNEGSKERILISLDGITRVATSIVTKQLVYLFDYKPNRNSYGYRIINGYKNGEIFEQWLPCWLKFTGNIEQAITNSENKELIIVKADIQSFYNTIPHDNLKRQLNGDNYENIDKKIKNLTSIEYEKYMKYLNFLFDITELIMDQQIGLPQGPAYARFLAELYLDKLDIFFESKIKNGDISFYQRYVDDIFFITSDFKKAHLFYEELSEFLSKMGLSLNPDKKVIKNINDFYSNFIMYRSNSKYIVDKMSKNFSNGTAKQKNLAINELLKIIQSKSKDDNLAFIFSHLRDVKQLDNAKMNLVLPTLINKEGRGSVFKHLFTFIITEPSRWEVFEKIDNLSNLQSEVLLSVLINEFDNNKQKESLLKDFFTKVYKKLSFTGLVQEELSYLFFKYNININYKKIKSDILLNTISQLSNGQNLYINNEIIKFINMDINRIKDLGDFVDILFPLASSENFENIDSNKLASIYFSKFATQFQTENIDIEKEPLIDNYIQASKFLYLICLFSLSTTNKSIDLLNSTWKYCVHIFNNLEEKQFLNNFPNWINYISRIKIQKDKLNYIITAIIEGLPFRGLSDKNKIFEKYHNELLLYVAFSEFNIDTNTQTKEALNSLSARGYFYEWISDYSNVTTFPKSSKKWFESNIMYNSTIILKKENTILIRKPINFSYSKENTKVDDNSYNDYLIDCNNNLKSINNFFEENSLSKNITILLEIFSNTIEKEYFPNIFLPEKILDSQFNPIDNEFNSANKLLVYIAADALEIVPCTNNDFIISFFKYADQHYSSHQISSIYRDYISKLPKEFDIVLLLKNILEIYLPIMDLDFYVTRDVLISSAIYNTIIEDDYNNRILKFTKIYKSIHEKISQQHIYFVDEKTIPKDDNPINFINTIIKSLNIINLTYEKQIKFQLVDDIKKIKESLFKTVADYREELVKDDFFLQFKKGLVQIQNMSNSLSVNGLEFSFDNVILFNYLVENDEVFGSYNNTIIYQSEHIYYQIEDNLVYLIAFQPNLSILYDNVKRRYDELILKKNMYSSYPVSICKLLRIKSNAHFNSAKKIISTHRNCSESIAEGYLLNWLKWFPLEYHNDLVTLIAGHLTMDIDTLEAYTTNLNSLKYDDNIFLMKRTGDSSGLNRILTRMNGELSRYQEKFSPTEINNSHKEITIVTDCILSGTSIISALNYYCGKSKAKSDKGYVILSDKQKRNFNESLSRISNLNIFTIFYTIKGLQKIEDLIKYYGNNDFKITIKFGEDISNNAFFNTNTIINEREKDSIRQLFNNQKYLSILNKIIENNDNSYYKDINSLDMITRYETLTKKYFYLLAANIKYENGITPFVRVREIKEIKEIDHKQKI